MLKIFRSGTSSKILFGFLGLALFAMVITGFGTGGMGLGDLGGGLGGDTVAEVGSARIGSTEVADQANRQFARIRQQQPDLDMGEFIRSGGLSEIIDQMVSQAALTVFGRDQGLVASKRMIDGEIASIPAFQNLAGQFDVNSFRAALARENISEGQLRQDIAGTLIARQLLLPAAGSPKVPDAMARQYASLLLEQRTGSIGVVPTEAMGAGTEPTAAEIAAFYKENEARYTIPERRVLRFATFGPEQVTAAAQPTDAEIAAFYKSNAARYAARETRSLSQVVLPDEAAARAFAQRIAGGMSFAQAATQAGFSPDDVSLGEQGRDQLAQLTSETVANAAFSAAEGAVTPPTRSPLGWHVIRVDAITRTEATPLAAARDEIVQQLAAEKREGALADLVTRIEDRLAKGATLPEVAEAEGLTLRETPPITASGIQFDNPDYRAPELQPVLETAFDMGVDEDPLVEALEEGQRFAILDVTEAIPAAPPPLAEVQDRVKADLVQRRALERARAVAASIVAKINGGTSPAQAFAEAQPRLSAPEPVTARRIDIARPNEPVPPPLAMLFSITEGKARLLAAPNGQGWFVVHLQESVPGDASSSPGLIQATRGQFEGILGQEYAEQFGRSIEAGLDIKRNEGAVERLRQQLAGPGAE